jgi:hypothetical protein
LHFSSTLHQPISNKNIKQQPKITQWDFELCPMSSILKTWEHNTSETGSVSVLRWGGRHLLSCVPYIELTSISDFGNWNLQFKKCCVLLFLEYQTTNKVQNPSNSECYRPLSEPFRI